MEIYDFVTEKAVAFATYRHPNPSDHDAWCDSFDSYMEGYQEAFKMCVSVARMNRAKP